MKAFFSWPDWILLLLALFEGGWLAFDGGRALLIGDYVTPSSGEYAGQLGPWADLVAAAGIPPRSTLMKSIHLGLGLAWLVAAAAFAGGRSWSRRGLLTCAVASLWYLPFGTLLAAVQFILLRRSGRHAAAAP